MCTNNISNNDGDDVDDDNYGCQFAVFHSPHTIFRGSAPNEVESVELFPRDNAKVHHTSNYEIVDSVNPALVIRRGDPFYIAVRLAQPYDPNRDKIRLEFMFGM